MSAIVQRLTVELRNRSLAGFVRFIASRLVQSRCDVLYEYDLRSIPAPDKAAGGGIVIIDRNSFGSAATKVVEESVLTGDNYLYVAELKRDAILLATTAGDDTAASYAFIIFESFYKRVLGEADAVPIICNCVTLPSYRGQGMYPLLLQEACRHLAAQGHKRVIVTCAPDNLASIRGIEKAGFRKVKTLQSLILFTRWVAYQQETLPQASNSSVGSLTR